MFTVQQAFDLAIQHHQAGRLAEAEALYRQILAVEPNHAEALHYLGVIATQVGRGDVAVDLIRRAITLNPGNAVAHSNLGEAYRTTGRIEEAIASCTQAVELRPEYAEAWNNLGNACNDKKQSEKAAAMYRRALELNPNDARAHTNLGNVLRDQHLLDEALSAYRRALALDPGLAQIHNNLGNAFRDRGELDEAIAAFRAALRLAPGSPVPRSNLISTLHFAPGQTGDTLAQEQRLWNCHISEPLKGAILPQINDRHPERRLRIGYVSADFRDHVVGRNLLPLFKHHDRRNFEILCYSGVVHPEKLTDEIRRHAHQWRDAVRVSDQHLADMIRQDGVDILVDLGQHTAGNRLPVFARRPAPVQASFAGYPESTGVEAIEYRISDRWLECGMRNGERGSTKLEALKESGRKEDSAFRTPHSALPTERVFLLDSFWCYDPCGLEVAVNALPAQSRGRVTFGCPNSFCKVNAPQLRLWARVLSEVPDSRLVVLSGFGSHRQRTVEFLEREGVAPKRVEFVEPRPREEYLRLYHQLDVVLDTFPYNGHTTSLDALWMGVPVVSLCGERPVSRAGLSQLSNIGLPELAAHSEDEYVNIATQLARDLPRLSELRRTLRTRMETSVLMDAPRFARGIEAAYRAMWQQWCMTKADA